MHGQKSIDFMVYCNKEEEKHFGEKMSIKNFANRLKRNCDIQVGQCHKLDGVGPAD